MCISADGCKIQIHHIAGAILELPGRPQMYQSTVCTDMSSQLPSHAKPNMFVILSGVGHHPVETPSRHPLRCPIKYRAIVRPLAQPVHTPTPRNASTVATRIQGRGYSTVTYESDRVKYWLGGVGWPRIRRLPDEQSGTSVAAFGTVLMSTCWGGVRARLVAGRRSGFAAKVDLDIQDRSSTHKID